MDNNLKAFLAELNELTNKYGIEVAGCNCCGSPYLLDLSEEFKVVGGELSYNRESKQYTVSEADNSVGRDYKGKFHGDEPSRLFPDKEGY